MNLKAGDSRSRAAHYYREAAELNREAGDVVPAARDWMKAGDLLDKQGDDEGAKASVLAACAAFEETDKEYQGKETMQKALTYLLKTGAYRDALDVAQRMDRVGRADGNVQVTILQKAAVARVVINIALGDPVAADRALMDGFQ